MKYALVLLAVCAAASAETPATFTPLDNWKSAVLAGDTARLQKLYSTNPPATLMVGKDRRVMLDQEVEFWHQVKADGLTDFNPKVLSITPENGATRLVLRLQGHIENGKPFVAALAQIWVPQMGGWVIAAQQRSEIHPDAGRRLPEPSKPNPHLYPEVGEAQSELRTALARAAREHKRVLVVFGGNWCYDCHVLDTTFRSRDFAPLLAANYIVLHINIGDEGKDNHDLATGMGVSLDRGVPSLAVLEPSGKTVVAQRNGEFESTERIGPEEVHAFLEKWKPVRK